MLEESGSGAFNALRLIRAMMRKFLFLSAIPSSKE